MYTSTLWITQQSMSRPHMNLWRGDAITGPAFRPRYEWRWAVSQGLWPALTPAHTIHHRESRVGTWPNINVLAKMKITVSN